jgi:hypothetical protein
MKLFLPILALSLLITLPGCERIKESLLAGDKAVALYHNLYNQNNFSEIYESSEVELKKNTTKNQFIQTLTAIKQERGKVLSTTRTHFNVNFKNKNTTLTMQYLTRFTKGQDTETFILKVKDKKAYLMGIGWEAPLTSIHNK